MKGKELTGILHDYAESNPLLRFLGKLSIVLVFIYPLVFLLGTVLKLYAVFQFTNLSLYIMLFSLALLFIERNWLILMISSGSLGLLEIVYIALSLPFFNINALTDLCLFGAVCVPSSLKFAADYRATHVPKPKAPKPVKPVISTSFSKAQVTSVICQKCGAAIQNPDAAFCNVCGSPLSKPAADVGPETQTSSDACSVCGKAYSNPAAMFCNGCGARRQQPEAVPQSITSETPAEVPAEVPNTEETAGEAVIQDVFTPAAVQPAAPEAVICPSCGIQCSPAASFCTDCGSPLKRTLAE
jgi:predicted amidophosphoribosyltransferase